MYFAALLARTDDGWVASDTDLDNVETLADIADLAREAAVDDDTVLVLIEQEDAWFGVVRVDGEDDPRVFVSNAVVAGRSSYGAMLVDELIGRDDTGADDLDDLDLDGTEDGEPDAVEDEAEEAGDAEPRPAGPLGDTEILSDLGVGAKELLALEGDALGEIADVLGCTEVLEAVR
ncbi:tRNA adenosine deaminase-associated protein [Streptomyces roseoverticillatus]|uniref:tRNA adenosine deaminase-associated protein n=1 Tax=Streptomyces roseoverticillatus TaxID=66429 RepID=A0ABV3INW2_9ACTN